MFLRRYAIPRVILGISPVDVLEKRPPQWTQGVPDSVYAPKWIHGKSQNWVSDTCCHKWPISKVEIFRKSGFSTRCTQSWGPKFSTFWKNGRYMALNCQNELIATSDGLRRWVEVYLLKKKVKTQAKSHLPQVQSKLLSRSHVFSKNFKLFLWLTPPKFFLIRWNMVL